MGWGYARHAVAAWCARAFRDLAPSASAQGQLERPPERVLDQQSNLAEPEQRPRREADDDGQNDGRHRRRHAEVKHHTLRKRDVSRVVMVLRLDDALRLAIVLVDPRRA